MPVRISSGLEKTLLKSSVLSVIPMANIITASMGTMRNPRSRKTEEKKYAAAENRIIQRMKNLVIRSASEVKALFVEFNFACCRQRRRGSDCGGRGYRFGSTPIAIFENP